MFLFCQIVRFIFENSLIAELKLWTSKYEEYITLRELKAPYKIYSVEELEGLSFGNKNAVIFLRGESGETLYEEGFLKYGLKQNNRMEIQSLKAFPKIIRNVFNNDNNLITNYPNFKNAVQDNETSNSSKKPSDRDNPVIIADKILERLSEKNTNARLSIIKIDTIPFENREKLGISSNNCVVLVLDTYEVDRHHETQKQRKYGKMGRIAKNYEIQVQEIISALENPNTPKEVLLRYIADSYGLLEYLTVDPAQPGMEPNQPGRGGRR